MNEGRRHCLENAEPCDVVELPVETSAPGEVRAFFRVIGREGPRTWTVDPVPADV